jgi:hypothetical protein
VLLLVRSGACMLRSGASSLVPGGIQSAEITCVFVLVGASLRFFSAIVGVVQVVVGVFHSDLGFVSLDLVL